MLSQGCDSARATTNMNEDQCTFYTRTCQRQEEIPLAPREREAVPVLLDYVRGFGMDIELSRPVVEHLELEDPIKVIDQHA